MESITSKAIAIWIKIMEFGYGLGCHQMPERSFFVKGYQFPICARCTGVFIGELLSIVLIILGLRISVFFTFPLLALMGIDWLIQEKRIRESTNLRRLITGVCAGTGLTYLYYYIFRLFV